ncbi:MAG: formylglycine-generating enzyme family protein [Candidatus Poribacteria bacterium]|nr:formylglycine-generating enzyme family protein [Candidatus Poribacteria bacterium]
MRILFKLSGLALICLFVVHIVSCGQREEDNEVDAIALVSTEPSNGSTINANGIITVTFDGVPSNVSVNVGVLKQLGATITISGPFTPGPLALTITWTDGVQTLTYTVATPTSATTDLSPEPEPEIIPEPEPIIPEGMVLIPEGEFQMGSNDGNADNDEQPVHKVHLDAFYIDANEVTNGEFKDFLLANPAWQKDRIDGKFRDANYLQDWNGNNFPLGERDHPVRYVSWYAAMAYAVWVDKRLPTEAEWEKAARGGLQRKQYPWGNGINLNRANYGKHLGETTPIGEYPSNDYGVHDIAGNVWEWCLDEYQADFYANSPDRNPTAGANNVEEIVNNFENIVDFRVLRGGGWNSEPEWLRASNRHGTSPAYAGIGALGFRCAKSVSP